MIEARVDWAGAWVGPLAPELHDVPPTEWQQVNWLEGTGRQTRRGFEASHRLRAFGWPCPRPLGCLHARSRGRLLLTDDARPLSARPSRAELESLGRLVALLALRRLFVPRLSWATLGTRQGEVVPLDLRGASRSFLSPTPRHLKQLRRLDLEPRSALLGLRAAAGDRPAPKIWARQWWAELARGETRSSGV